MAEEIAEKVRLDKWLWAARFFKTRSMASEAVSGGKVHLEGNRVKPGHSVRVGNQLRVRRGYEELELEVLALSEQRGSAAIAQLLYRESAESQTRRAKEAEIRKMSALSAPRSDGRPNKRERRQLGALKQRQRSET